jgi:DNA-binding transcriptional MerR regulator
MKDWTDKYQGWDGTASELADVATKLAAELGVTEGAPASERPWRPNERLVRHYRQVGILSEPVRSGKEALFGFRQIIELLATRVLLNDGWPLAKIKEFVRLTDDAGLLGLLPRGARMTPAQEMVSRFKRRAASGGQVRAGAPPRAASRSPPGVDPMRQSVDLFRQRQEAFPEGTLPEVETWLHIKLTPWCHIYIEREAAHVTPPDLIEHLSRQLAQALIEFIRRGDKK